MKRNGLPRYCCEFRDRHGNWRVRFRRRGESHYFKARPGTDEFGEEYRRVLGGDQDRPATDRTTPGTISALIERYYRSGEYLGIRSPQTKRLYRGVIEAWRNEHGDKRTASLQRKHVKAMIDAKATTPFAANELLKRIRMLMQFAIANDMRSDDPTIGIKSVNTPDVGYHTWTEHEAAQYEAKFPLGTMGRLTFDLLLWTDQRISDVVKMGRQHLERAPDPETGEMVDWILVKQQKTGTPVWIPVQPELAASLAATPTGQLTFVLNTRGKPYTYHSLRIRFAEWCKEAGLPDECRAHGLRKLMLTRIGNKGGTHHELKSLSGHKRSAEVDLYTRAYDQRRGAASAFRKLKTGTKTV